MNHIPNDHFFKLFTEAYPGVVSYIDQELKYQFVSESYQEWFGTKSSEAVGKHVSEIIGLEFFEERKPFMQRALAGEKVIFQSVLWHKSFGRRNMEQIYHPDVAPDGKVKGIFALAHDVTERILQEKNAEESQKLFRAYAESMPYLAFIANPQGQIIHFNKQWQAYTGVQPNEDLGGNEGIMHPEDYPRMLEAWSKSIKTSTTYEIEHRIRRKDGVYRWHLARAVPLKNSDGEVTKWMATIMDIHQFKENESQQARLLQVLESSTDFIALADFEGNPIYLNRNGMKLVGLDETVDYHKLHRRDFFSPEDWEFSQRVIKPLLQQNGSWTGEFRFRHFKTKETIWVHYNSFLTKDEKTGQYTGYASIARDISDLKAKEYKLKTALRTRDEFLSIASHELKTPLTSLKLQAQLFLRSLKKGDPIAVSEQRLVNMANHSNELVSRLSRLIDDMLDVSRIRTGKLTLDKTRIDLCQITHEVVERMSMQFEAAQVPPPIVHTRGEITGLWDKYRIEQVLTNLLTNAIRYGKGRPVEITLSQHSGRARICVKDQGYGIHPNDHERIFDRFERAIDASEVSGMGLGLFITKQIVKSHGGSIWVESELGQGANFIVELPIEAYNFFGFFPLHLPIR